MVNEPMIKAIVFDLWETLGTKNISVSKMFANHFKINITSDFSVKYETAVQLKPWKTKQAMVENFLRAFALPITQENCIFLINLFDTGIANATPFTGTVSLLEKLHQKYKLGLLSNTTIFESEVPKNWKIQQYFDAEVYSWQLKSLKPAPKNYQAVCTKLQVKPEECIFIDDNQINIQSAQQIGMSTIHFYSNDLLIRDLTKLI